MEYLKHKGLQYYSAQGRMMDAIELTDDFSQIKPHFILNPEKRRFLLYFTENFPLKTSLALMFLIKENYPIGDTHKNMLRRSDVIHEYFIQNHKDDDNILDTIRQIITLGYKITSPGFYYDLESTYSSWGSWNDLYSYISDIDLKAKTLFWVMFECGLNVTDYILANPEVKSLKYYLKYMRKVTLYELVFFKLYNTRFNILDT
jgi:hypothetical protein